MDKKAYMDEQLNVRCFYLRLMKKIIWVPVAAVIGAVIGALLYMAVTRVTQPVLFEAKVQLYLHFVENATNDKVYDYYNAYTWNDLIRTEKVREKLEDPAVKEASRAEYRKVLNISGHSDEAVEEDFLSGTEERVQVRAEQPSDIRVLWIQSRARESADAMYMSTWMAHALVEYGAENEVFRSIEITQPVRLAEQVTYTERLPVAMLVGAVLAGLLACFFLMVSDLLDDAVYVPEDAEKRYGLPVVAVVAGNGKAGTPPECLLEKEAEQFFTRLEKEGKKYVLLTADTTEEERARADVYLLDAAFGKKNAALTQHVLSQARARGENVEGIVMTGADMSFLAKYYRL